MREAGRRLLPVVLGIIGCSGSPSSPSIVPDPDLGRRAIEAAMGTWKAGHLPGIVEPTSPRVQVADTHRRSGQRLEGYEILGESADPRARTFTIRLTLDPPRESPVVRFLVVGIDPILVFREEDYEMLIHWEHRMEPAVPGDGADPSSKRDPR